MEFLSDFIQYLFSSDGWPARWVCGRWTPFHGWLYIISGLAIWLAYFTIPTLLLYFVRKRKQELPFKGLLLLFIAFIFACGLTHLMDSIMFWYPAYRLSAVVLFGTAVISWVAVISLFKLWPQLLAFKSPAQVEAIIEQQFKDLLEKLRKSEERWQFALEGSELGVWDWHLETDQNFFSKRWKQILGYEEHEIKNEFQEWFDRVHPEDRDSVLVDVGPHTFDQRAPYRAEYRIRCKDGSYKWVRSAGMVMACTPAGKPLRMVGTLEDIHGAKIFQEMLRLSESTFSSAFHFSGIGMGFLSPLGGWLDVNPALCQLLGYSRQELLQKTFQEITHPDDLQQGLDNYRKMLDKEVNTFQQEKRYVHKDGRVVWAMLTVSLVWESEDKPRFFIAQIVDITKSKDLLMALAQNNETLQVTALDLQGKIQQLEEFNRIVAHNLRGPASNIHMLLGMLPQAMPDIKDNIYFEMLSQSSENLKATLQELMKVVELRLNRDIPFDTCDVDRLLDNILVSCQAQLLGKAALVERSLEERVIHYPKVYLESIIYNLVSNALKYSRSDVPPRILVRTYAEGGRTVLSVKDNGLGIDLTKYGNQVFKLKKVFHQGFDSKGVGLFMTKNQVETFGGSISLQSKPMEGSEFIVKF